MGPHICFSAFGSGCCPGWMLAPGSGQCVLREYGRRGWHRVGVPAPSRSRAPQRSAPSAAAAASALRPTSARAPTESGASPAQVGPPPPHSARRGAGGARLGCGVPPVPRRAALCLPEPLGNCGEYGCDLSCNHGGCQEVARVCPLGFSMVETDTGVRCNGEPRGARCGRGGAGGSRRSPAPGSVPSRPQTSTSA